jgi:hypothetical protein
MRKYPIITFLLLIVSGFISCKKSGTSTDEKKEINPPIPTVNSNVDVYVGGRLGNYAAYWKNDEVHQVNSNDGPSYATAIAVQGNDVYLAGTSFNALGEKIITYWKNGVPTYLKNLGNTTSDGATGIAVHGNDIYVIARTERYINGSQTYSATLWKNGVASYITDAEGSFAYAITITNNGDVYIAGRSERRACYWKNGVVFFAGERDKDSWAFGMCVSGADVYLAGSSDDAMANGLSKQTPVYWKNGIKTALPITINGNSNALRALCISVDGINVYVGGSGSFQGSPSFLIKALYWKNGVFNDISATNDAMVNYNANAVAAYNTDVYVAVSSGNKAYLLQNGTPKTLNSNGTSSYYYASIIVLPK